MIHAFNLINRLSIILLGSKVSLNLNKTKSSDLSTHSLLNHDGILGSPTIFFSEYLRRVTLKPGEVQPKITSYRGDPNNRSIPEEDEDDKENKTGLFLF